MSNIKLIHGDCLKEMDKLIDESVKVDAIIADVPYGTIKQHDKCKWDYTINPSLIFERLKKLISYTGAIVLFSDEPYTSFLITEGLDIFRYKIIAQKTKPVGFPMANYRPLKRYEEICVFSKSPATYIKNKKSMTYNPQGLIKSTHKQKRKNSKEYIINNGGNLENEYVQKYTNYPCDIIEMKNTQSNRLHPTQKPLDFMEYLVRTYTNSEDLVLDFTMGSGTTGVACKNTNRKFIGIELDEKYFNIAKDRIENT